MSRSAVEENRRRLRQHLRAARGAGMADAGARRAAWRTSTRRAQAAPSRRPMRAVTRRPAGSARSRWPIACRCCLRPRTARWSARRMPAGAGWRPGCWKPWCAAMRVPPERLLAWLGPAHRAGAFRGRRGGPRGVPRRRPPGPRPRSWPTRAGGGSAISTALARRRLAALGRRRVYGGALVYFADAGRFFSYRRDGRCGRMAALIWRA